MTKSYSHISLILLWLSPTHRPPLCRARKKEGDDSDPPKSGGSCGSRVGVSMWHAFPGLPGGRYRRYLSLREGSETADRRGAKRADSSVPPFPLASNDPRSVLAVKGPLRRVPRPGPLRADPKEIRCLRGKRGVGVSGRVRAERNLSAMVLGFQVFRSGRFMHSRRRSYYLFLLLLVFYLYG